jgi:hypothetical protein
VTQAVVYVSLTGQQSSIEGTSKVSPLDSVGRGVTGFLSLDPSLVNIQVPIIPLTSYKTLPVLVPLSGQARAGFGVVGVNVQPPDVTANGTPSTLNHISSLSTYPVSISNRGGGRFSTRVKLHLPRGVHVSQQYVTVTTQLGSVEASTSIETAVSVQNVANGLVAHTNVSSVLVTVVGPSSTLRHAAGRMRAVLDLTNDGIGTYQLTPKITTPAGLRIEGVYPSQVVVVLRPSASG